MLCNFFKTFPTLDGTGANTLAPDTDRYFSENNTGSKELILRIITVKLEYLIISQLTVRSC